MAPKKLAGAALAAAQAREARVEQVSKLGKRLRKKSIISGRTRGDEAKRAAQNAELIKRQAYLAEKKAARRAVIAEKRAKAEERAGKKAEAKRLRDAASAQRKVERAEARNMRKADIASENARNFEKRVAQISEEYTELANKPGTSCEQIPNLKKMCKLEKENRQLLKNFEKGRRIYPRGYKPGKRISSERREKLARLNQSRYDRRYAAFARGPVA